MGLEQSLYRRTGGDCDHELAYWRKANYVHRYFTECWEEKGFLSDNCTEFPVTIKDLEELLEACTKVLSARDEEVSMAQLPTQSGFFFGDTYYDEGYYESVEYTLELLKDLIPDLREEDELYYYAWY